MEIVDNIIGEIIEDVIVDNAYEIDFEEDYDNLLYYIYSKLSKAWFGNKTPGLKEFEHKLRAVKRTQRTKLQILLSYLVSRYLKYQGVTSISSKKERKGFREV